MTQLARGDVPRDRDDVVKFWSQGVASHALFMAHMLDPKEVTLINQAHQTACTSGEMYEKAPSPPEGGGDPVLQAAQAIVDFETAAEQRIDAGQIKSIIHPAIADHMRREAIKS